MYTLIQRSFGGNGVWTHVNSKGKIPSTGKCPQRRIKPATLWTASPSTTSWAIPAPCIYFICFNSFFVSIIRNKYWIPHRFRICLPFFMFIPKESNLTVYVPSRSLRSSTDDRLFRVPRYSREAHGGRAFTSSAVKIWNYLPQNIRHSPSLPTFKRNLKTFLFQQAFFWRSSIAVSHIHIPLPPPFCIGVSTYVIVNCVCVCVCVCVRVCVCVLCECCM